MKDLDQHDIITEAVYQIIAKLACNNAILVQYKNWWELFKPKVYIWRY